MAVLDVRSRLAPEVPGLLRYARTIVADGQLAEDLVQETLLRALQRADTFRGEASLATWLHRILHNLAVDGFRRDREDARVPLSCWDARSKVSDYLDGELLASDRALVQRHLETCPTCPPLYAGLLGTRAALGSLRDADTVVPPTLSDRINELLNRD